MDVKERPKVVRRVVIRERRMVGQAGLEPATPRLSSVCSNQLSYRPIDGVGELHFREENGGKETRTPDILLAKQALYQLSYAPSNLDHEKIRAKLCTA